MAVDDRLAVAVATGVFIPSVDDDLDRFFLFARNLLIAANVIGWLGLGGFVWLTCSDGYC